MFDLPIMLSAQQPIRWMQYHPHSVATTTTTSIAMTATVNTAVTRRDSNLRLLQQVCPVQFSLVLWAAKEVTKEERRWREHDENVT